MSYKYVKNFASLKIFYTMCPLIQDKKALYFLSLMTSMIPLLVKSSSSKKGSSKSVLTQQAENSPNLLG
jgi:hypothetical protein